MSLFQPDLAVSIPPEESIAIVHNFLQKCLQWAEEKEIPKTLESLQNSPSPEAAARLHQWTSYRDFTRHTLRELEDGTLDHWFQTDRSPDE